jgi:hypothetical protein
MFATDFRQLSPGHDAMPFGLFLAVTVFAVRDFVGSQGKPGYRHPGGGVSYFGITA